MCFTKNPYCDVWICDDYPSVYVQHDRLRRDYVVVIRGHDTAAERAETLPEAKEAAREIAAMDALGKY